MLNVAGESASVQLQLPGEPGFVALSGQICSVRQDARGVLFGIQFELEQSSRHRLYGYLLTVGALPEHQGLSVILTHHLLWLSRVTAFLEGKLSSPPTDLSENECSFGQWFKTEAASRYAAMPQLGELEKAHSELHRRVGKLINAPKADPTVASEGIRPLTEKLVELAIALE